MIRYSFLFLFPTTILFSSCTVPCRIPADDHVVQSTSTVCARANQVLKHLVMEYGSSSGRWKGNMSRGCAEIWACQLGFRAGLRRSREDLLLLARLTADTVSDDVQDLILDAFFGDFKEEHRALHTFPALLFSALLDGKGTHWCLFMTLLDRVVEEAEKRVLRSREYAALGYMCAEVYRTDPENNMEYLRKACAFADMIDGTADPADKAFVLAGIACITGKEEDIRSAAAQVDAAIPPFDARTETFDFPEKTSHILSHHLALIHALADMVKATGESRYHHRARALLRYVFSDAGFDGSRLSHDWGQGNKSAAFCAGCNFNALYLVDRLYGDTWKIPELPALSEAEDEPAPEPWELSFNDETDGTLTVSCREEEDKAAARVPLKGKLLLLIPDGGWRFIVSYEKGVSVLAGRPRDIIHWMGKGEIETGKQKIRFENDLFCNQEGKAEGKLHSGPLQNDISLVFTPLDQETLEVSLLVQRRSR